jgi:FAD/FMN-containing dehydrogenase
MDKLIEALRASLDGAVIDRAHPSYGEARRVWNGIIDRYPTVIARCAGTADVVQAVRIAQEHRPLVSIRGGGHQIAGSAVCDDGLVIDLSAMKAVQVDPVTRTVRAEAGATWAEVDGETQLFGLVTPGGEVSSTGIAGFTLGGGLGLLMRPYGLSCDNLRSIEIVTSDGVVRTASRDEHADLFWAARGGGRGLGVVTSFEFGLQSLGPKVAMAQLFYPYSDAPRVLRAWRDLTPQLPDTVASEFILWSIPPDQAIPAELHGSKVAIVAGLYAGDPREGTTALAPLAELGTPLMDLSETVDYVAVQSSIDAAFPAGGRYFFKSHFMAEVADPAIDVLLNCDARRANPESLMVFRALGGAITRIADSESAFPHRGAQYNLSIDASWFDPALDQAAIGWARSAWDAIRPFGTGGMYVNFAGLDDDADRDAVYGWAVARLHSIRAAYDPEGVFAAAAERL